MAVHTKRQMLTTVVVLCVFLLILYNSVAWYSHVPISTENKRVIDSQNKTEERAITTKMPECRKRIVIYTASWHSFGIWREHGGLLASYVRANKLKNFLPGSNLPFIEEQCPEQRCTVEIIATNQLKWLNGSHAVIMNVLPANNKLQQQRAISELGNKTKWFFFFVEGGDRYQYWSKEFKDHTFQYTISYTSDSTVWHPYGHYIPNEPTDVKRRNWAAEKTKFAAWMSSFCKSFSWPRKDWVRQLQTLIPLDMYGKCGNLSCGKYDPKKPPSQNTNCIKVLQKYKFYIAAEKVECDELISEKFWENSLLSGAVPVVYGGRKWAYTRVAPPHSFIHVSDFKSIHALANYLKYLDANDDKYNEYLAWRYKGRVERMYPPLNISAFMCRMVPVLQRNDLAPFKTVGDNNVFTGCSHSALKGTKYNFTQWKPRSNDE